MEQLYTPIYNAMKVKNSALLNSGIFVVDKELNNASETKYCIALYNIFTPKTIFFNKNFDMLSEKLECMFSRQITYAKSLKGILHHTILQIISFNKYNNHIDFFVENKTKYFELLQNIFKKIKPFKIYFKGIISVPSGIVMYGIPSINLNNIRDTIRSAIANSELIIDEPYKNDIVHSTLVRYSDDINEQDKENIIEICSKYSDIDLGYVEINSYTLGLGTWKLLPNDIKNELILNL